MRNALLTTRIKVLLKGATILLICVSIASCSKDDDSTPQPIPALSSISPTNGPKTTIVIIIRKKMKALNIILFLKITFVMLVATVFFSCNMNKKEINHIRYLMFEMV